MAAAPQRAWPDPAGCPRRKSPFISYGFIRSGGHLLVRLQHEPAAGRFARSHRACGPDRRHPLIHTASFRCTFFWKTKRKGETHEVPENQ